MKNQKRKQQTLNGIHLWSITTDNTTDMWITTRRDSIEDAIKKAIRFEKSFNGFDNPKVSKVENHGTLDA